MGKGNKEYVGSTALQKNIGEWFPMAGALDPAKRNIQKGAEAIEKVGTAYAGAIPSNEKALQGMPGVSNVAGVSPVSNSIVPTLPEQEKWTHPASIGGRNLPASPNETTTNMGVIPPLRPEDIRADLKTGGGFLKQAGIVDTGPNGEPIFTNKSLEMLEAIPGRGAITQVTDADTIKDIMARRTEAEAAGVSGITDFTDYMSGKKVLPGVTEPNITFDSLFRDMVNRRQRKTAIEEATGKANVQKTMMDIGILPTKEAREGKKSEAEIKEIEARTGILNDPIREIIASLPKDSSYDTPEQAEIRNWAVQEHAKKAGWKTIAKEGDIKQFKTGKGIFKNGKWEPYNG